MAHFDATVVVVAVLSVRCELRLKKKLSIKRWEQLSIEHQVGLIEAGGVRLPEQVKAGRTCH